MWFVASLKVAPWEASHRLNSLCSTAPPLFVDDELIIIKNDYKINKKVYSTMEAYWLVGVTGCGHKKTRTMAGVFVFAVTGSCLE